MYKPKEAKLFGAAIKQFLTEINLSQRQFAKQAGFGDASYISKLVNPKPGKEIAEPRKEIRQQLAKGLGLTEQEFLEYIEQYRNSNVENKTLNFSVVEPEKVIAKPQQKSEQPDASSIEERIFQATNQLDPERPMFSRMSAIQALGEIAKDYSRYQWNIMEILAAFIRANAPRKEEGEEERSPKISEDIQAALTVIGQRNTQTEQEDQKVDLHNTDIAGADLSKAKLQEALFWKANLRKTVLIEAELKGARFMEANLQGALLIEANLQQANLLNANLQQASIRKANLREAWLWNANLQGANLMEADLQGAILSVANLQAASLVEANLKGTSLVETNLQEANLIKADLQEANLGGANMHGASLYRANLRGAILMGANLKQANLTEAQHLEPQQLELAYGDSETLLPQGFTQPTHWMKSE
ncbi:MAG: pentapeptide repeat-containing protein [Coleofasciculaceae cyanobacterium]